MTKALRSMKEDIKLIDLVIEVVDARIPQSSRNPEVDALSTGKKRIIVLNKSDLSDPSVNKLWAEHFRQNGMIVIEADSKKPATLKNFEETVNTACVEKIERDRKRGIKNRPVRCMVIGIPNVGKSTFINTVSKKSGAKTGNKPGVTRGKQWIALGKTIELLDTPGILWPKFEDEKTGLNLALIGSMNDEILDISELCCKVLEFFKNENPSLLKQRYGDDLDTELDPPAMLIKIASKRNVITKGNEPDINRMSSIIMEEFRSGKIGRVSLERP